MQEAVRLVVWDMDETFWQGTLAEGGIKQYVQEHHDIVIELARRGIMSSICSKNDEATVRKVLEESGLWKYFIFPSIDWTPKGPRLKQLVELVQLRPQTILFIDDNPSNLGEALRYLPEIQVGDEHGILALLQDPRFVGKPDHELTRLDQYKVLETKHRERAAAVDDSRAFLVGSNIQVQIEHDVVTHIDRAVELINRTNQLNFTKNRLSEDPIVARAQLNAQLSAFDVQCGLVSVKDRYGDYGFVGFYLLRSDGYGKRLLHFCFSCRTLNMGVETFVYQTIGRPALDVVGEVLTDVSTPDIVDWINLDADEADAQQASIPPFVARGGCDLSAITHYFSTSSPQVTTELVVVRDGIFIRFDHSLLLRYAMDAPTGAELDELLKLGYLKEDFESRVVESVAPRTVRLVGFWGDAFFSVYRHKTLGLLVPFELPGIPWGANLQEADPDYVNPRVTTDEARAALDHLREHYECIGSMPPDETKATLHRFLDAVPDNDIVFLFLANEDRRQVCGAPEAAAQNARLNAVVREVAADHPRAHLLQVEDFVEADSEFVDLNHFSRMVYFRIAEAVRLICQAVDRPEEARVPDLQLA